MFDPFITTLILQVSIWILIWIYTKERVLLYEIINKYNDPTQHLY